MLHPTTIHRVILCPMLGVLLLAAMPATAQGSNPKTAALEFFEALERGDLEAARAVASGVERPEEILNALAAIVGRTAELERAVEQRFGKAAPAKLSGDGGPPGLSFARDARDAKVETAGDTARLHLPGGDEPVVLRRLEGEWKVDLSAAPGAAGPGEVRLLERMGEAMRETAREVEAGQYANAEQASEALAIRLLPLIFEGGEAGEMEITIGEPPRPGNSIFDFPDEE